VSARRVILQSSIQKAKASGQSFDEWAKGWGEKLSVQQKGMAELSFKVAKEHGVEITKNGDLVLYHGTQVGRAPKVGDDWRVGSYFTSDPKVARQFAQQGGRGQVKVIKVEVPPYKIFPSGDGTYYTLNEKMPIKYKK